MFKGIDLEVAWKLKLIKSVLSLRRAIWKTCKYFKTILLKNFMLLIRVRD